MKKNIAKKIIILYILDAIEKGSSIEKPLSITIITKTLNGIGVHCERRTVSRNINYLIQYGKPIIKLPNGKVFYNIKKEI